MVRPTDAELAEWDHGINRTLGELARARMREMFGALAAERERADSLAEWQQKVAASIGYGENVPPYGWNIADADSVAEHATEIERQASEHDECPTWCDVCERWEPPRTCKYCNGTGAGPGCALGAYEECQWCAGDGRTHEEESAEARIAKALDLIRSWRSSVMPDRTPADVAVDVRNRLRDLYAALDGEVQP
jgi:hypothetical protein